MYYMADIRHIKHDCQETNLETVMSKQYLKIRASKNIEIRQTRCQVPQYHLYILAYPTINYGHLPYE